MSVWLLQWLPKKGLKTPKRENKNVAAKSNFGNRFVKYRSVMTSKGGRFHLNLDGNHSAAVMEWDSLRNIISYYYLALFYCTVTTWLRLQNGSSNLFAGDLALLLCSPTVMQPQLDRLQTACLNYCLIVETDESKVAAFRKSWVCRIRKKQEMGYWWKHS